MADRTSPPADRLTWLVEQLDLRADHLVLEVGCGHGVAATVIAGRLPHGCYVGVDRSPAMVAASQRRKADHCAEGRTRFVTGAFTDVAPGLVADHPGFDRILAARVVAMTRGPELTWAERCLAPGGMLVLGLDSPDPARTTAAAASARQALATGGWSVVEVTERRLGETLVSCIRAVPPAER